MQHPVAQLWAIVYTAANKAHHYTITSRLLQLEYNVAQHGCLRKQSNSDQQ